MISCSLDYGQPSGRARGRLFWNHGIIQQGRDSVKRTIGRGYQKFGVDNFLMDLKTAL